MSDRLAIRRDFEAPPGGWRYTVPETGVTVTGLFAHECRQKALDHMRANQIEVPDDFEVNFEDAACRESGHGPPYCGPRKPKPVAMGRKFLTWHKLGQFLKAVKQIIIERKIVSREEAERRVAICQGVKDKNGDYVVEPCPLATNIGGCGSCSGITHLVKWAAGEEARMNLQIDQEIPHCGACGCLRSLLSIVRNDALDSIYQVMPDYHEGCWRREENRLEGG